MLGTIDFHNGVLRRKSVEVGSVSGVQSIGQGQENGNGSGSGSRRSNGEGRWVSARLLGVKKEVERERVKDGLRGWLSGRRRAEMERRLREEWEAEDSAARSVKGLVRRFGYAKRESLQDGCSLLGFSGRRAAAETADGLGPPSAKEKREWVRARDRESRWGRGAVAGAKRKRDEPTRAHVWGLRRFWEGVGAQTTS